MSWRRAWRRSWRAGVEREEILARLDAALAMLALSLALYGWQAWQVLAERRAAAEVIVEATIG